MYLSVIHNPIVTHYVHNFTLFSREKRVKFEMLSLFSRNEKWNDFWFHFFREVKVKLKCFEIEIEKWNCKIILENSRETRLSQVTVLSGNLYYRPPKKFEILHLKTFKWKIILSTPQEMWRLAAEQFWRPTYFKGD